jgi:cobalt-zinc-cadmium efflux system outer membrane protein
MRKAGQALADVLSISLSVPLKVLQIALLLLAVISARPLSAIAAEIQLGLAQALDQARAHNPLIEIARARVSTAEGVRTQADLIPNPRLTATSENTPLGGSQPFRFEKDTDDYIYLSQKIELDNKRQKRAALATENVNRTSLESELALRQLLARVATAYWSAQGAAAIAHLYERQVKTLDEIVGYNRAREQKGALPGAELIRIQLEADTVRAQASMSNQEARRALISLYREMGATTFPESIVFTERFDRVAEVRTPDIETILRNRAEMRIALEGLKQAAAKLNLQRANAIPDPDLLLGYKRFSGIGQHTGLNTLYFGIQAPLPLFDRNQGNIAAAEAEVRAARGALSQEEITVRAEVASALGDYQSQRQSLIELMPRMNARATETYKIVGGAYRLGGADLLRFLDAERVTLETQVLYVQAFTQYHHSVVNLKLTAEMPL